VVLESFQSGHFYFQLVYIGPNVIAQITSKQLKYTYISAPKYFSKIGRVYNKLHKASKEKTKIIKIPRFARKDVMSMGWGV